MALSQEASANTPYFEAEVAFFMGTTRPHEHIAPSRMVMQIQSLLVHSLNCTVVITTPDQTSCLLHVNGGSAYDSAVTWVNLMLDTALSLRRL